MRIISGVNGGRKLISPSGNDTRPTSDALRETAFNILVNGMGHSMTRVLDLFSGTGAMGFEAHSRGAESVVFVEKDPQATSCILKNAELCKLAPSQMTVIKTSDLERWAQSLAELSETFRPFDTIFCDPPYNKKLVERSMKNLEIKASKIFIPGESILIAEVASEEKNPNVPVAWELLKEREKASTRLLFYRRSK